MKGSIAFHARIADEDVEGSELAHGRCEHRLHLGLIGDVGLRNHRAPATAADFLRDLLGFLGLDDVVHHHISSGPSQRDGDRAADAGVGAGDQRHLALQ